MPMITAEQFRQQYAKTGDKRTKKKTAPAKYTGESQPGAVRMVVIEVDDVTHYIPETNTELIAHYQKLVKSKAFP